MIHAEDGLTTLVELERQSTALPRLGNLSVTFLSPGHHRSTTLIMNIK